MTMMILAVVALALAIEDIQSSAALDEQARSLRIVAMASALPLVAVAYIIACSRRGAPGDATPESG